MIDYQHLWRVYQNILEGLQDKAAEVEGACDEAQVLRREVAGRSAPTSPFARSESIVAEAGVEFSALTKALRQAQQAQDVFSTEHSINYPPYTPNVHVSVLTLALMAFAEGGANAAFFLDAHMSGGLMSALLASLTIASTNIIACTSAGYFIGRKLNYGGKALEPNKPEFTSIRKTAQYLHYGFIGVMGFFHLNVGLIRSTQELELLNHSIDNYMELVSTPSAVFLVIVGVAMSVIAYVKGLRGFDDPYFNLGNYHRAVEKAKEELYASRDEYAEGIEDIFAEVEDAISSGNKIQQKTIANFQVALEKCCDLKRKFQQQLVTAKKDFSNKVQQYLNTQSVISGEKLAIADEDIQQFSFDGLFHFDIPKPCKSPDNTKSMQKLENAKASALKKLSDLFKHNLGE